MFNQYALGDSSSAAQKSAKLGLKKSHRKTKYGCKMCRTRRVKCDEAKPTCRNCTLRQGECIYDRLSPLPTPFVSPTPFRPESAEARVAACITRNVATSHLKDPPETKERRVLEAKLMHQYVTTTGRSVTINDDSKGLFDTLTPKIALTSEALMYLMYAVAGMHLHALGDSSKPVVDIDAIHKYLSMGLREHHRALQNFSTDNADSLCLSSSLLRVHSFIMLQSRSKEPYDPPVEWLMFSASTKAIVYTANQLLGGSTTSAAGVMLGNSANVSDKAGRFDPIHRRGFERLLERDKIRDVDEAWDEESQKAYETTLSFIGGAAKTLRTGEWSDGLRWLILFPMVVNGKFIELVQQRQPRAIVFLAHYFAMLALHNDRWWIGDSGTFEVEAIAAHFTGSWGKMLEWPNQVVKTRCIPPFDSEGESKIILAHR